MDPLSFAASLIGVVNFAGTVVAKLYMYFRAVKDCDEDVVKLRVELDVFAAVIDRLAQIVGDEDENEGIDEGEDKEVPTQTPGIPPYLVACHSALLEIDNTLVSFDRKASKTHSSHSKGKGKGITGSLFGNLSKSDLKWPLAKPKTMEIITRLERYKDTCVLALAADELSAIKEIFENTKLMSEDITEVRADTNKLRQAQFDKEVKQVLRWFCPVNPHLKHQEFRKEYQHGTCLWIFDQPEYRKWSDTPNSALWIHAIPGAGKTVLASQIIEVLSVEKPKGLAYFYCRYDDATSQQPHFILGSLVDQLARQDKRALDEVRAFHSKYHPADGLPRIPTESDLKDLIVNVSQIFDEVTLVVDGLDEVGSAIHLDRTQLVQTLSTLHSSPSTIRTIILSRAEADIQLNLTGFDNISIAATSGDLKLYVSANMGSLNIKSLSLKSEVLEALVDRAEGMFYWTVCQIQLLKDLPTPASMRKALRNLPPGLPATYVKIFEAIDARYPVQTQRLIQRALHWLVFQKGDQLSLEALCHAIAIEDETTYLDLDSIPDKEDVCNWLGCLVRRTARGSLELAHFSIKEFIRSSSSISSEIASKYLPKETGERILMDACFSYLSLTDFSCVDFDLFDKEARAAFDQKFPFYYRAAFLLTPKRTCTLSQEPMSCCRLFKNPPPQQFFFWIAYYASSQYMIEDDAEEWTITQRHGKINDLTSPLNIACTLRMVPTVSRLISEGVDPNQQLARRATPMCSLIQDDIHFLNAFNSLYFNLEDMPSGPTDELAVEEILQGLITAGGDVNATSECGRYSIRGLCSPLYLALWYGYFEASKVLLDNGARVICSLDALDLLLEIIYEEKSECIDTEWDDILRRILESDYEAPFRSSFEMALEAERDPLHQWNSSIRRLELQRSFFASIEQLNKHEVYFYISRGAALHSLNQTGRCALTLAIEINSPAIADQLRYNGASLHTIELDGNTPLISAFKYRRLPNVHDFVGNLADLEFSDNEFQQISRFARYSGDIELLEYIISAVAKAKEPSTIRSIFHAAEWKDTNDLDVLDIIAPFGLLSDQEQHHLFLSFCIFERMHMFRDFLLQYSDFYPQRTHMVDHNLNTSLKAQVQSFCYLCWASAEAPLPIFEVIFERTAAMFTESAHLTHLCIASSRRHCGIAGLLLNHVENPNNSDNYGLYPILYAAYGTLSDLRTASTVRIRDGTVGFERCQLAGINMIQLLVSHGCNLASNRRGYTAMHIAMEEKSLVMFMYLLSQSLYLHAPDAYGTTPLHVACRKEFTAGVAFILSQPGIEEVIDCSSDLHGTPFYCAAVHKDGEIVQMLLEAGASVDKQSLPGNRWGTPLYGACVNGREDAVWVLLSHGANPTTPGPRYNSAVAAAQAFAQHSALEVLEKSTKALAMVGSKILELGSFKSDEHADSSVVNRGTIKGGKAHMVVRGKGGCFGNLG